MSTAASSGHPSPGQRVTIQEDDQWMRTPLSAPAPSAVHISALAAHMPSASGNLSLESTYVWLEDARLPNKPKPLVPSKRARTEPEEPAKKKPPAKKKQDMGGMWMKNIGWTGKDSPCLLGWMFVQGWWDWGTCDAFRRSTSVYKHQAAWLVSAFNL